MILTNFTDKLENEMKQASDKKEYEKAIHIETHYLD